MIDVKSLAVSVGSLSVLEGISFQMKPGEFVAIVGPNGAGKSTLLKAIAGDLLQIEGEVLYDGDPVGALSCRAQAERRAFLEQQQHVNFPFTVEDLVRMGKYFSRPKLMRSDEDLLREVLLKFGINHLRDRQVTSLSGGEAQRVHAARVMLQVLSSNRPHGYLLLDEPISSLDVNHQYSCLHLFKEMTQQNIGVLAVLHDLNIAAQFADRLLILQNGCLVDQGSPAAVLTQDRILEVFGMDCEVMPHPHLDCPMMVYRVSQY